MLTNKSTLGKYGQSLLDSELLKRGYDSYIIGNHNIDQLPDIIIKGNISVEVKTSVYSNKCKKSTYSDQVYASGWQFGSLKRSKSDFCVLILLEKDLSLYKFLTFPSENIIGGHYFYYRPDILGFKGSKGRVRKETLVNTANQGLNLLFTHLEKITI